jgi:hypothetical protein
MRRTDARSPARASRISIGGDAIVSLPGSMGSMVDGDAAGANRRMTPLAVTDGPTPTWARGALAGDRRQPPSDLSCR